MEGKKTLYGLAAFIPMLIGIIGVAALVVAVIQDINAPDPPVIAIVGMAILGFAGILNFAAAILYIVHIANNRNLDGGVKAVWIIGIVFLSMLIPIVYFFVQIVPESQPLQLRPANEWDAKLNA